MARGRDRARLSLALFLAAVTASAPWACLADVTGGTDEAAKRSLKSAARDAQQDECDMAVATPDVAGTFETVKRPVQRVVDGVVESAEKNTWRFAPESDCHFTLRDADAMAGCLAGSWVVVAGASLANIWTTQLANTLAPGVLDSLRDHFTMNGVHTSMIDIVIANGEVTYKKIFMEKGSRMIEEHGRGTAPQTQNTVGIHAIERERKVLPKVFAHVKDAPPYDPGNGTQIRITNFVAQFWDSVELVLDALEGDTGTWSSVGISLVAELGLWYAISMSCKKDLHQEWCATRPDYDGKTTDEMLSLYSRDLKAVLPRMQRFCSGAGPASTRGCVVASIDHCPTMISEVWEKLYRTARERVQEVAMSSLRFLDLWRLTTEIPEDCMDGHQSPLSTMWTWQLIVDGFCSQEVAPRAGLGGELAVFEGPLCSIAQVNHQCRGDGMKGYHFSWECALSEPCSLEIWYPPSALGRDPLAPPPPPSLKPARVKAPLHGSVLVDFDKASKVQHQDPPWYRLGKKDALHHSWLLAWVLAAVTAVIATLLFFKGSIQDVCRKSAAPAAYTLLGEDRNMRDLQAAQGAETASRSASKEAAQGEEEAAASAGSGAKEEDRLAVASCWKTAEPPEMPGTAGGAPEPPLPREMSAQSTAVPSTVPPARPSVANTLFSFGTSAAADDQDNDSSYQANSRSGSKASSIMSRRASRPSAALEAKRNGGKAKAEANRNTSKGSTGEGTSFFNVGKVFSRGPKDAGGGGGAATVEEVTTVRGKDSKPLHDPTSFTHLGSEEDMHPLLPVKGQKPQSASERGVSPRAADAGLSVSRLVTTRRNSGGGLEQITEGGSEILSPGFVEAGMRVVGSQTLGSPLRRRRSSGSWDPQVPMPVSAELMSPRVVEAGLTLLVQRRNSGPSEEASGQGLNDSLMQAGLALLGGGGSSSRNTPSLADYQQAPTGDARPSFMEAGLSWFTPGSQGMTPRRNSLSRTMTPRLPGGRAARAAGAALTGATSTRVVPFHIAGASRGLLAARGFRRVAAKEEVHETSEVAYKYAELKKANVHDAPPVHAISKESTGLPESTETFESVSEGQAMTAKPDQSAQEVDRFSFGLARCLASLHVVAGHLHARGALPSLYLFSWGFTWVPWFFMLSGFILFTAEVRRPRNSESCLDYVVRRAVKVYPAYVVSLLIAFILAKPQRKAPGPDVLALQAVLGQAWIPTVTESTLQTHCWFLSCLLFYWFLFRPLFNLIAKMPLSIVLAACASLFALPWLSVIVPLSLGHPGWYHEHTFGKTSHALDIFVVMLKFHPLTYLHVFMLGMLLARCRLLLQAHAGRRPLQVAVELMAPLGYVGLAILFLVKEVRPPEAKLSTRLSVLLPLQAAILMGLSGIPGVGQTLLGKAFAPLNFLESYSYQVYVMQFICYHLWPSSQAILGYFLFLAAVAVVMVHVVERPVENFFHSAPPSKFRWAWAVPAVLAVLFFGLGCLPDPASNSDLPRFQWLANEALDMRLPIQAADGRAGADLINPSILIKGDEIIIAARQHKRESNREWGRSPGAKDTDKPMMIQDEIWHSEILLARLRFGGTDWKPRSWLRSGEPPPFPPLERWTGLHMASGSNWSHPCVREWHNEKNGTITRLTVTGPEDPKVIWRGSRGLTVAFNSYPPQGKHGCIQQGINPLDPRKQTKKKATAVSQMYLASGLNPAHIGTSDVVGTHLDCGKTDKAEKNWIPFLKEGELYFVYKVLPHRVMKVDLDDRCGEEWISNFDQLVRLQLESPWMALRGSAQALLVNTPKFTPSLPQAHYLALFHAVDPRTHKYAHFAYRFASEPPFEILQVSGQLPLRPAAPHDSKSGFAFVSGLAVWNNTVIISYTAGDRDPRVLVLSMRQLDRLFSADTESTRLWAPMEYAA